MKTRIGFVSNSSSSSFVVVGFEMEIDELNNMLKQYARNHNIKIDDEDTWFDYVTDLLDINGYMYDGERTKPIVGQRLASNSDCDELEETNYSFEEIREKAEQVAKDFGLSTTLVDIQLITGQECC